MLAFLARIDQIGRNAAPIAFTIMLVLLAAVPLPLPHIDTAMPWWGLMAVFYWALHRPDLLPPLVAFAIGLLEDALSGTPFGLHALMYIMAYWAIVSQRRLFLGTSFLVLWWSFGMVAAGSGLLMWVALSAIHADLISVAPILVRTVSTIAAFPLLAWLFIRVQRAFLFLR